MFTLQAPNLQTNELNLQFEKLLPWIDTVNNTVEQILLVSNDPSDKTRTLAQIDQNLVENQPLVRNLEEFCLFSYMSFMIRFFKIIINNYDESEKNSLWSDETLRRFQNSEYIYLDLPAFSIKQTRQTTQFPFKIVTYQCDLNFTTPQKNMNWLKS